MSIKTRLKALEATAKKTQAEWPECLTDEQLLEIIYSSVPGYPYIDFDALTDVQLERIAAGEDPAVVLRLRGSLLRCET